MHPWPTEEKKTMRSMVNDLQAIEQLKRSKDKDPFVLELECLFTKWGVDLENRRKGFCVVFHNYNKKCPLLKIGPEIIDSFKVEYNPLDDEFNIQNMGVYGCNDIEKERVHVICFLPSFYTNSHRLNKLRLLIETLDLVPLDCVSVLDI